MRHKVDSTSGTGSTPDGNFAGRLSTEWRGIFPRYAWHREGDTVYQAVLSNEELGEYHAYPLESPLEWPKHMR